MRNLKINFRRSAWLYAGSFANIDFRKSLSFNESLKIDQIGSERAQVGWLWGLYFHFTIQSGTVWNQTCAPHMKPLHLMLRKGKVLKSGTVIFVVLFTAARRISAFHWITWTKCFLVNVTNEIWQRLILNLTNESCTLQQFNFTFREIFLKRNWNFCTNCASWNVPIVKRHSLEDWIGHLDVHFNLLPGALGDGGRFHSLARLRFPRRQVIRFGDFTAVANLLVNQVCTPNQPPSIGQYLPWKGT